MKITQARKIMVPSSGAAMKARLRLSQLQRRDNEHNERVI
jgi:hypothetical protein